jgi:hypothetical protein
MSCGEDLASYQCTASTSTGVLEGASGLWDLMRPLTSAARLAARLNVSASSGERRKHTWFLTEDFKGCPQAQAYSVLGESPSNAQ